MGAEIWSVMDIICCHFRLFFSLTTWKIKLLKNWKNTWRYYHFTHVYHIGPFKSLTTQKIEIVKKGKKPWRYYHFTHVYGKWQSNDPRSVGWWTSHQIFKKGGFDKTSTFREGLLEKRGVTFSIFFRLFFSIITKNSNWDLLLKNLVTFKR